MEEILLYSYVCTDQHQPHPKLRGKKSSFTLKLEIIHGECACFFICYLAAPRSTLGHSQGAASITQC